jgi:hypothetical protein
MSTDGTGLSETPEGPGSGHTSDIFRPQHAVGKSGLHNARPTMWLEPSARYRHRELKRQFCHIVHGGFTPVLAKHSKSFSLVDSISVGGDRMQRNFEPMRKQVELWHQSELTDVTAKMVIYQAFIEGELGVRRHLARRVHDLYFDPSVRRVQTAYGVELVERVHFCVQGSGPDSAVPGNS